MNGLATVIATAFERGVTKVLVCFTLASLSGGLQPNRQLIWL
jgi:hypothetical protein